MRKAEAREVPHPSRGIAPRHTLNDMSRYLTLTRTHSYSLLFALPLLLLYEAGAIYIARVEGSSLRNGADVLLQTLLAIGGLEGTMVLALVALAAGVVLIVIEQRRRKVPVRFLPFLGMAAESVFYAACLGIVVGTATQWLLQSLPLAAGSPIANLSTAEALVLSFGAGLYEELLFRVIVVGGIFAALRGSGLSPGQAGVVSVLAASVIFAGFHYIGPYGDPWALPSFLFRFLAGVLFSVIFLLRGFGITAWAHALYDVMVLL